MRKIRKYSRFTSFMGLYLRLLSLLAFMVSCEQVEAQTVNLLARHLSVEGRLVESGRLCARPVDGLNHLIATDLGLPRGVFTPGGACAAVDRGFLADELIVPDIALTHPKNVCLRITISDAREQGKVALVASCLQPSGTMGHVSGRSEWCAVANGVATCDLDKYLEVTSNPRSIEFGGNDSTGQSSGQRRTFLDADAFSGTDFSGKVIECVRAVESMGGGTCDASNLVGDQSASQTIVVGDGKHQIYLILPIGRVHVAAGKQLIYRSYASIVGQGAENGGSEIRCDKATTDGCVISFNEALTGQLIAPALSNFSIQGEGIQTSIGLVVGGSESTDVLYGRFSDLRIGGFDTATQIGGDGGCTCYNRFDDIDSEGVRYGVKTVNFSKYPGDANSNTWIGGRMGGNIGLSDTGGKNKWISIDIEGARTHGMELAGYGTAVISPYEEANGCDLINGNDNFVEGSLAYGGGSWSPCPESTSTTSFWWGPDAAPNTIGVNKGLLFASHKMFDDGYNSAATLYWDRGLDLKYSGLQSSVYGRNGHAPMTVGHATATSGLSTSGKTSFTAIRDPSAPGLEAVGGSDAAYTYFVVGYDADGGLTRPSPPATVNGPAVLGAVMTATPASRGAGYKANDVVKIIGNRSSETATARVNSVSANGAVADLTVLEKGSGYNAAEFGSFATGGGSGQGLTVKLTATHITVTPFVQDGIVCVDTLKTDTRHLLPAGLVDTAKCTNHNSLPVLFDYGQALADYRPSTRNTTGDVSIDGALTVNGAAPTMTIASGTVSLVTKAIPPASCQPVDAGSVNSAPAIGVLSTDTIEFTPNKSIKGVAGFGLSVNAGLTIEAYPTKGYVNFDVCNRSKEGIAPGPLTLNWRVPR